MKKMKAFVLAAALGMTAGVLWADDGMDPSMNMPKDKTIKTDSMPSTDQTTPMPHKTHKHKMKKMKNQGGSEQGNMGGMGSGMGSDASSNGSTGLNAPQDSKPAPMGHM